MQRGITTFKCDVCGHTMSKSLFSFFTKGVYRKIWEEIDKNN